VGRPLLRAENVKKKSRNLFWEINCIFVSEGLVLLAKGSRMALKEGSNRLPVREDGQDVDFMKARREFCLFLFSCSGTLLCNVLNHSQKAKRNDSE
jgi:hypothetical protein